MSLKEILKDAQGVPTGEYKDIAGGTMYADSPIGSILPYGGTTAPSGWMICNGASLLRTDYAELFAVIGTAFGSADSTHFNIPDLRGEFLRGAGTNSHSEQGDGGAVGEHQNGTTVATSIMGNGYGVIYNMANGFVDNSTYDKWVGNSGNTYLHNTSGQEEESYATRIGIGKARPTNTSVNYIIKAMMVALPADLEAAIEEGEKYSTTEVKTNKTWIDGKPIYRKVYVFPSNVAVQGNAWTSTGMAKPANIEAIVGVSTIVRPDQRSYCVDVSATTSDTNLTIALLSNVTLNITKNSKLVLEYTKTTD